MTAPAAPPPLTDDQLRAIERRRECVDFDYGPEATPATAPLSAEQIVDQLRAWCAGWDGAPMARDESPRYGLYCGILLDAAAALAAERAARERAEGERKEAIAALAPLQTRAERAEAEAAAMRERDAVAIRLMHEALANLPHRRIHSASAALLAAIEHLSTPSPAAALRARVQP